MTVEAYDPDDIKAALGRLRAVLDAADDEAGRTGTVSLTVGREIGLLGADVYVMSKRLHPEDESSPHRSPS